MGLIYYSGKEINQINESYCATMLVLVLKTLFMGKPL